MVSAFGGSAETYAALVEKATTPTAGSDAEAVVVPSLAPRPWRTRALFALPAALLAAGVTVWWLGGPSNGHSSAARPWRSDLVGALQVKAEEPGYCGLHEDSIDYPVKNLYHVDNVLSAESCCDKCQAEPACRAWTWGKIRNAEGLTNVCYLKSLHPGEELKKKANPDVISGLPFRKRSMDESAPSLFCFGLVLPWGKEMQLLRLQLVDKVSLFMCDEFQVYSNQEMELVPGVTTAAISADLKCNIGGPDQTCLNTWTFMEVWKKVVVDGRFRFNEWTVKTDPDSVFFPDRLRLLLRGVQENETGLYYTNCEQRLRGSIEVLSRRAVQAWALGYRRCMAGEEKMNFESWGEDKFLDQCMSKVLKVQRKFSPGLLSEARCNSQDWASCQGDTVAFHPFKTVGEYSSCLSRAARSHPRTSVAAVMTTAPSTSVPMITTTTSLSPAKSTSPKLDDVVASEDVDSTCRGLDLHQCHLRLDKCVWDYEKTHDWKTSCYAKSPDSVKCHELNQEACLSKAGCHWNHLRTHNWKTSCYEDE